MTFDDYQKKAAVTALFSGDEFMDLLHWTLGVGGEAGEITEKIKKIVRDKDGKVSQADKEDLMKEIGDVLWYLALLAKHLGYSFDDVAAHNLSKLKSRHSRGVIKGSGDNR
ncbi:MAG TPA: nucleoside triphosphate pyrophosphohydrolase family protein [Candidatus Saccharimonadales bacterium]|nr:nucleoside triphosphate pyrophosphohydrolase family protein [Candidatus Saccharimonadales bacterium]